MGILTRTHAQKERDVKEQKEFIYRLRQKSIPPPQYSLLFAQVSTLKK